MTDEDTCKHGYTDCEVCRLNRRLARLLRSRSYIEECRLLDKYADEKEGEVEQ